MDVCRSIASLYPISFPWLPESTQNSAQTLLPDFVVSKLRSAHMHILHLCILGCYFNTCGTPILCIIGACMRVYIFAYKFVCVTVACICLRAWYGLLSIFAPPLRPSVAPLMQALQPHPSQRSNVNNVNTASSVIGFLFVSRAV